MAAAWMLVAAIPAWAHEGEDHGAAQTPPAAAPDTAVAPDAAAVNVINNRYLRDVKPIFKRVCFDCHSDQTRFPSYYVIPGVKQLIDWDIREAREHIDMKDDFPFKGHGTPLKDLKAINKEVEEGEMPPFYYTMLHWKERLTSDESQIIQRWATEGIKLLPPGPADGK